MLCRLKDIERRWRRRTECPEYMFDFACHAPEDIAWLMTVLDRAIKEGFVHEQTIRYSR